MAWHFRLSMAAAALVLEVLMVDPGHYHKVYCGQPAAAGWGGGLANGPGVVSAGRGSWESIARKRSEDLLVYLALARFNRRPPLSRLPLPTQRDVKAFFATYQKACQEADTLLFRAGNAEAIDEACQRSPVGRLVENALIIPHNSLPAVEPLLRMYEGCARALVGEVEGANVIKLHRFSGKVTYLVCRRSETGGPPPVLQRIKVALRSLRVDCFNYAVCGETPAPNGADCR